jgi:hypothetical protein
LKGIFEIDVGFLQLHQRGDFVELGDKLHSSCCEMVLKEIIPELYIITINKKKYLNRKFNLKAKDKKKIKSIL